MIVHDVNDNILKDFAYKVKSTDGIILFLGAGISELAGLPNFTCLIKKIKANIKTKYLVDIIKDDGLETVIQLLRTNEKYERDKRIVLNIIKEELKIRDENIDAIWLIFEYLLCLPIKGVITTNYDELVEKTLHKLGKEYEIANKFEYQSFSRYVSEKDKIPLFKIHGSINNPDIGNLIIGYKDKSLEIRKEDRYAFIDILSFLIAQHPILFIGYSFKDNFIESVIEKVSNLTTQENIFTIIKKGDKSLNENIIRKISTINISDFQIGSFEKIIEKTFYYYYSNAIEDSILKYDLKRLKKKLLIDLNKFFDLFEYKSGLFQSLGYVLYYSDNYPEFIEIYEKIKSFIKLSTYVSNEALVDFTYFEVYRLLINFSEQDLSLDVILESFDSLYANIKSLKITGQLDYIHLTELKNKIQYYKIVVAILAYDNGLSNSQIKIKESDFKIFKEPIDVLTRMKIYKFQSIYFRINKQYEKSLQQSRIANYHSKYLAYKREKILIRLNEQITLLELSIEKKNPNKIYDIIQSFKKIKDDFQDINYWTGLLYANVYLYRASGLYVKLSKSLNERTKTEMSNLLTVCKNSISQIKSRVKKENILILFSKIQDEIEHQKS